MRANRGRDPAQRVREGTASLLCDRPTDPKGEGHLCAKGEPCPQPGVGSRTQREEGAQKLEEVDRSCGPW